MLLGLRDQLSENQRATANLMKAIEAGIITLTTKGRLVELEAEASRLRDAITLEEAAQTHIERDFMVYWFEKFRGGDLEDAAFRRRVIDSFVNAVYLWDDRLRVAFNYSGKGSAVDMELVMDAEALAGPEGRFVLAPRPPPCRRRTTYRSRRLFCKSHLSLILSRLLSKPQPLCWLRFGFWCLGRRAASFSARKDTSEQASGRLLPLIL